jgi:redox-sensitive bicupin YhaK (pirin superfamily)
MEKNIQINLQENQSKEKEKDNKNKSDFLNLNKIWRSQNSSDGNGVALNRVIGNKSIERLVPFLMLDYIEEISLPGGFPDHMHRGFETVTYMLKGELLHEDFKGNKGKISAGDVQWMTAGKGIVHSEIPASYEKSSGFQLWIDLKKENKLCEPKYQEIKSENFPIVIHENNNYEVKVISGVFEGKKGNCISDNPTSFFDVKLKYGKEIIIPIQEECNGFIFNFEGGDISIEGNKISKLFAGSFSNERNKIPKNIKIKSEIESDYISHKGNINEIKGKDSRFLVIFGKPFNQPVCQRGPVVMCTEEEIYQAFKDYREGKNGFENAYKWKSENSKLVE